MGSMADAVDDPEMAVAPAAPERAAVVRNARRET
jgi:hypothetical protein